MKCEILSLLLSQTLGYFGPGLLRWFEWKTGWEKSPSHPNCKGLLPRKIGSQQNGKFMLEPGKGPFKEHLLQILWDNSCHLYNSTTIVAMEKSATYLDQHPNYTKEKL